MRIEFNMVAGAPKRIAPYSHSVLCGDFLMVTGQMPIDPTTNEWVRGSIENQTMVVMENIKNILIYSQMSIRNIVQCRVFLSSMELYDKFNVVYEKIFVDGDLPARTCIAVSGLAGDADVEIDVIACRRPD